METLKDVMHYYETLYLHRYESRLDEMKMHKLLYFAQRESFVRSNEPLFNEDFHGWRYGPVLHEVRSYYANGCVQERAVIQLSESARELLDYVFDEYAGVDSWTLSLLSHDEFSWKQSRRGLSDTENGDRLLDKDDIRKDALYVRVNRRRLANGQAV